MSEELKTCYLSYSAFWLTGQWGGATAPLPATILNGGLYCSYNQPNRTDEASAAETVEMGSITGRVKSKTIKIDIYSFPA